MLAQASRARLFRLLGELRRPAGTEELAEALELHPNGVRAHLERLHDAGLVVRERERRPRGRPRDIWSISLDAHPGGDPPSAYADLSRWLVRSVPAGKSRVKEIESTGREIGRELAVVEAAGSPEERMHHALAALGFRPTREVDRQGTLSLHAGQLPVPRGRAREPAGGLRSASRAHPRASRPYLPTDEAQRLLPQGSVPRGMRDRTPWTAGRRGCRTRSGR